MKLRKTTYSESIFDFLLYVLPPLNKSLHSPIKLIFLFNSIYDKAKERKTLAADHFIQETLYFTMLYAHLVLILKLLS